MPIDEVPHYQVISKNDLVANLRQRVEDSSRTELIALVLKFAELSDPKTVRNILTS
jgi:hypothetical protein